MSTYTSKFEIGDVVWFKRLGHQYNAWNGLADLLFAKRFSACTKSTKCTVKNLTLHTSENNKVFVYLLEDEDKNNYLVNDKAIELYSGQDKVQHKVEPQQHKPRSKWVKNTGEKPDLPDGTLVKVIFKDTNGKRKNIWAVESWNWDCSIGCCAIDKWKLADDWNKVVDAKAPDIDPSTLVEVKNMKEHGGYKVTKRVDELHWDMVKKWRYAKKD